MQRPAFELYMVHQLIHFKKGEIPTTRVLEKKNQLKRENLLIWMK
jgi:hypothetical protein